MTALVSGEADIGFMGSESSIYAFNEGAEDYAVNFAQLTQRAGNFLVARKEMPDFTWEQLKGTDVLGGRNGGMPEMVFEYILKQQGIDPDSELSIDKSIDFGSTAAAFTGGQGDYTVEFEPGATTLEQEGVGYVAASLGVDSGYVPYTAYSAKASYLEERPEVIQKFTDALQRGMDYVNSHTPEEIAQVIRPQFVETDLDTITAIVRRYAEQDTWNDTLIFEKASFELLQDMEYEEPAVLPELPGRKESDVLTAEQAEDKQKTCTAEPAESEMIPAGTAPGEEQLNIDPLVLAFLDADSYEQKLMILDSLHNRITDDMINTMAVSSDLEIKEGDLEDRYLELRNCLRTFEKFECNRLR